MAKKLAWSFCIILGILCAISAAGYLSVIYSEESCYGDCSKYIGHFLKNDIDEMVDRQVIWLCPEEFTQSKFNSGFMVQGLGHNLTARDMYASRVTLPSLFPFVYRIRIQCYGPKSGTAEADLTYLTFFGHSRLIRFDGTMHPDGFGGRWRPKKWDPRKEFNQ